MIIQLFYPTELCFLKGGAVQIRVCEREIGEVVNLNELIAGDIVFVSGRIDYYYDNPANGVGHVGIATGNGTIIHATYKAHVIETPLNKFIDKTKFRGARRYIPKNTEVLTFETPADKEIEISDDIRWIVLQSL